MKMTEPVASLTIPRNSSDLDGVLAGRESASLKARNLRISLKQWKMFHAVIDFDGFFGAADNLHVTQSTISHAVAKLQEQLGIPLLELKGRKARITEEGKILLEKSRDLVKTAIELEELADNLRRGWGAEIRLAIDPGFPPDLLMQALQCASTFPQKISLNVKDLTPDQVRQALQDNEVELAISTQLTFGFAGRQLIEIEHIAVAHPDNPLFSLKRDLTVDDLKTQSRIAIAGLNHHGAADSICRVSRYPRPWHVSSLDRAISVLRHGIGYAWLPRYQVQQWIDGNQIRSLPLASGASYKTHLYLISGSAVAADSAARRFADALHACSERFS